MLTFPIETESYTRTFAAEIDVLADNTLLVRGELQDQRVTLAHQWTLRTPAYEILDPQAQQFAGDAAQFAPELCERYAAIAGIRIGRGFTKYVLTALGDLPGAHEHLLLALEMARVGQQLYQFPPEFEAQFPSHAASTTAAARTAWLKDRAYMSDLANSCYTYRNETAELFDTRTVRCGFDDTLTRPQPGDRRAFWRNKRLTVTRQADGFACESAMEDRIHDILIRFDLSNEGLISNAASRGLRLPYHGICEDPQLRTVGLNGLRVTPAYVKQFAEHVGGATGCTHLFDLSLDCLRLFQFSG
ncbi:MAG: DUF2889 domain-containing protein [Acidobacteria bacterium]|nr:DUF2889 domain-containing protein [Acidobacteriota bacterium]